MTRRRKIALALAFGSPVLVVVVLALYLRFADLSGWREFAASKLSQTLGREVVIHGEFTPAIGPTALLTATDVTVANPDWCSEPSMATIQRLSIELELLSLLVGPLTIHDVEVEGVELHLEKAADGRANWDFSTAHETSASEKPLDLTLRHVIIDDLRLNWRDASRPAPMSAGIARFESTEDPSGMLEIALTGTVEHHDLEVSGRLGTLAGFLNGSAVDFDLSGHLDTTHVTSTGHIDDLKTLAGAGLTAAVRGDDLAALPQSFAVPSELTGPFSLSAEVSPSGRQSKFEVDAAAAGITAAVSGTVDALLAPKSIDATLTVSGPSIRTVGSLTGVMDLPDEPFSVSGGVRWEGFPITFRRVQIRVGDNSLAADGVLGAPPEMKGTDFSLHGEGPDIASIAALTGVTLPRDPFTVNCRLIRAGGGLEIEALDANVGRTEISASGRVGNPPGYAGTALDIHAAGPNLGHFNRLIGMDLPAVDFAIDGRLSQGQEAIALDNVTARVGTATIRASGSLHTGRRLSGTSLKIDARGSDATQIMLLAGFMNLPDEPWAAAGGLTILDSGYRLDGVTAEFGNLHAKADGLIAAAHRSIGTHLDLHVEDSDLSHAMLMFDVPGFPRQPVRASGTLRIDDDGYRLDGVTATAGDIEIAVDGLIGDHPNLEGTRGHVEVHGPRLASVGPFFLVSGLPEAPFSVVGNVQVTGGRVDLEKVVTEIASNRVTLDGTLAPVKGLVGTDVRIDLAGPDLERAGRLAAGLTKIPALPTGAFTLATRLRIANDGYEVTDLRATLDRVTAAVDGRFGTAAGMVGTDLTVTADGPDASVFAALSGVDLPAAPFKVSGRLQRTATALFFDRVAAEFGGHAVKVHGSLGERPRLIGTELDLEASGPGTVVIAELTGLHKLPDEPFRIKGHFEGTPEKFTVGGLELVLGSSDLRGTLEVDIRGKPDVTAQLRSDELDLAWLSSPRTTPTDAPLAATPVEDEPKAARLISDTPINFGWLQRADGEVDVTVGVLQMPVERFHDLEMEARLEDGRLDVHHLALAGSRGGTGSGSLVLEPTGSGYRGRLQLDVNQIHLTLPGEEARTTAEEPPFDLDVRLQAEGATPHQLAASSNGSIQVVFGKGVMDNRALDLISRDILLTLLTAFNPFAKEETATELQCAIALLTIEDGLATLDPMAMQSDKMTMLGEGKIDFKTEKLDLDWVTKPRKGIGLSASMITNPYIKLGGTLARPAVELKGAQAVASTGVAVATLGISLVAKGMLDRATAEKKVCKIALEEIAKRTRASTGKSEKTK